jgi:hypothetical protein
MNECVKASCEQMHRSIVTMLVYGPCVGTRNFLISQNLAKNNSKKRLITWIKPFSECHKMSLAIKRYERTLLIWYQNTVVKYFPLWIWWPTYNNVYILFCNICIQSSKINLIISLFLIILNFVQAINLPSWIHYEGEGVGVWGYFFIISTHTREILLYFDQNISVASSYDDHSRFFFLANKLSPKTSKILEERKF